MNRNRLAPGVEGLEGRRLLSAVVATTSPVGLAAPPTPLAYQFGHYDAVFRFAGGEVTRSQIAIEPAADGTHVAGSRAEAAPGTEQRLSSVGVDPPGRNLTISKTSADGSVMHGVYKEDLHVLRDGLAAESVSGELFQGANPPHRRPPAA